MEIIRDRFFYVDRPTAVAIGKFDGLHLGHQKLLKMIIERKNHGNLATIFTFSQSFEEYFTGKTENQIYSREYMEDYLEKIGIDLCVEFPLNQETVNITAEDFIKDILIKQLNMTYIAAGEDLSFGKGGKGNRELCEKFSQQYGYKCDIIKKVCIDGEEISSTRIRKVLGEGRNIEAGRLLGRIYL